MTAKQHWCRNEIRDMKNFFGLTQMYLAILNKSKWENYFSGKQKYIKKHSFSKVELAKLYREGYFFFFLIFFK